MEYNFYRIWGIAGIAFYLAAAGFTLWGGEANGGLYIILSGLLLSLSYIAHLRVLNHLMRNYVGTKSIEHFFTPIITVGILAAVLSFLPDTYILFIGKLTASPLWDKIIDICSHYLAFVFFSLALCTYGRLILEQKLLKVYRQIALFKSYLLVVAFTQLLLPFSPKFLAPTLLLTGLLSSLPLLSHLRWVAVLTMRDKWVVLFYLSILNLLCLFFIQKLYYVNINNAVDFYFWTNIFGFIIIFSVFVYGLLSWLALVFSIPLASFIEEQRSEIAAFQEMSRGKPTPKEGDVGVWKRLFEACYKNTGSEAGWLAMCSGGSIDENPLIIENILREQISILYIKLNIKDQLIKIDSEGDKSFHYYMPNLRQQDLGVMANSPYRSLLVLVVYKAHSEQPEAIVCLAKSFSDGYSRYMIELCQSYIAQANLALENMLLVSETVRSARVRRELEIAGRVQQALMPKQFPENPYCEIAGHNEPAVEVGGDYYDYCRIDDRRLAFIIGDVSGKGASAAFHMAQMKGIFQSLLQFTSNAEQFMTHANHAVARCMETSRFISVILLLLDFEQRTFTYSRAGHCPLMYYNAATQAVDTLMGQGMALGIIRNNNFERFIEAICRPICVGDVFLLYTDGLVEARRRDTEEQFGYERLKNTLEAHCQLSAEQITQQIYSDFRAFSEGSDFKDDTSFLVIKIVGDGTGTK